MYNRGLNLGGPQASTSLGVRGTGQGAAVNQRKEIYFADLTHTAQGISAPTFPLGVSYVAAYVKEQLKDQVSVQLFKFPEDLDSAIIESPRVRFFYQITVGTLGWPTRSPVSRSSCGPAPLSFAGVPTSRQILLNKRIILRIIQP